MVAIDCTVLLLFFDSLWLWQRKPWVCVLGRLLLVKLATTGFTLAATTALGAGWVRGVDPFQAFLFILFAVMVIGALGLLVLYLRGVREGGRNANGSCSGESSARSLA